jgi:hypothetical protein
VDEIVKCLLMFVCKNCIETFDFIVFILNRVIYI